MTLSLSAGLSSCEDVPAPYKLNLDDILGGGTNDSLGRYRETPYGVPDAISAFNKSKTGNCWVKGYIVGYVPTGGETSTTISNTVFGATDAQNSNIVLAASATESLTTNCMVIQLQAGELRDALNLKDHADNLGKSVLLYGSLEKYFGGTGLKSTSYAEFGEAKLGKDPDSIQTKFEHISIKEFLEKKDTKMGYELTGVVTNIANATYGNFDLAEDGASVYIYGLLDKDGATQKFTSLGIEVGDTVTLRGAYTDYQGKAEIVNAQYVSHVKGVKQTEFERITIAKFLELKDETIAYELEGVATNINENFASFDLTQDGSSVYVYKTVDDKGNKVSLAGLGVTEGSTIVVRGKYYPYVKDGVTKDEINPATFVELVSAGQGGGGDVPVGESVTLDFSTNTWGLPEGSANGVEAAGTYTNGTYSITLAASTGFKYYFNSSRLMLGKQGAYLTLPAFDFAVSRIDVTGASGASAAVKQNLYVGETAVSTQTVGATATNKYEIAADYQAAGNQYTLKVESAHNTQISKIVIYKATEPEQ